MIDYCWPSWCLDVRDLDRSAAFYEACGFERVPGESAPGIRIVMRSGGMRLGLFSGITTQSLNFRGGDIEATRNALLADFPEMPGELHAYLPDDTNRADAGGVSWWTEDPDGHPVFFDTNAQERGPAFVANRIATVLLDAARELERVGASAECLEALQKAVIEPFVSGRAAGRAHDGAPN